MYAVFKADLKLIFLHVPSQITKRCLRRPASYATAHASTQKPSVSDTLCIKEAVEEQ